MEVADQGRRMREMKMQPRSTRVKSRDGAFVQRPATSARADIISHIIEGAPGRDRSAEVAGRAAAAAVLEQRNALRAINQANAAAWEKRT